MHNEIGFCRFMYKSGFVMITFTFRRESDRLLLVVVTSTTQSKDMFGSQMCDEYNLFLTVIKQIRGYDILYCVGN